MSPKKRGGRNGAAGNKNMDNEVVQEPQDAAAAAAVAAQQQVIEIDENVAPEQQTQPAAGSSKGRVKGRKKGSSKSSNYKIYIYRVLKQVCPNAGISSAAMSVMNSFVEDMFGRIAMEAQQLGQYNNSKTISSREIESSVRFVLPGQLIEHAIAEGRKAITQFANPPT
eukprot:TRINITY_DN18465_c0_g1_i1.p4 TRINITY_DN18465_c0_g1~~TRINITY_DN18465_c0_g1_i1.p4  ORF type:complete len:168 (-),score=41.66 TRINITY_DN18465_c0_g1_i1:884-1387(-)